MELKGRQKLYLCALALIAAAACTRQNTEVTKLGINLPTHTLTSQSANDVVDTIIINVQGNGAPPFYFEWENQCRDSHLATCVSNPPPSVEINFPNGAGRIVQVLYVLKNRSDDSMGFRYGDQVVDLNGGTKSVDITASAVGTSQGKQANVIGRYYDASGMVVTGNVDVRLLPPLAGRPEMIVHQTAIYSGWINAFAIDNITFKYYLMPQNSLLFTLDYDGAAVKVNGTAPELGSTSVGPMSAVPLNNLAQINLPKFFRQNNDGASSTWEAKAAQNLVVGFFGPGAPVANYAYYDSPTGSPIANIKKTAAGTGDVTANNSPSCSTANDGDSATPVTLCIRGGGAPYGSPSGTEFVDYVHFQFSLLSDDVQSSLGYQGPFLRKDWGSGYKSTVNVNISGTSATVQWQPLPNLNDGPNPITGYAVFQKLGTNQSNDNNDIEPQTLLAQGYVVVGQRLVSEAQSLTVNIGGSTSGMFAVVGYRELAGNRVYLRGAARGGFQNFNVGGSGPALTFTDYNYHQPAAASTLYVGTCVPFHLEMISGGQPVPLPAGSNYQFQTSANVGLYYGPDCGSPLPTGSPVPTTDFYVQSLTGGPAHDETITVLTMDPHPPILNIHFTDAPALTAMELHAILPPGPIQPFTCLPVTFYLRDGVTKIPIAATANYHFDMPSSIPNMRYYTYGDCISAFSGSESLPIGEFNPLETSKLFYFKYGGTATSINLTPTTSSTFAADHGTLNPSALTLAVTQPSATTKISLSGVSNTVKEGDCIPVGIHTTDASGRPNVPSATTTLTLGGTNVNYFLSNNCMGSSTILTVDPSQFQTGQTLYFQVTAPGPAAINITSSLGGISSATKSITATPAVANQIAVVFPGVSWDPMTSLNPPQSPPPMVESTPQIVELYAVKYNFQIDPNYNGPLMDAAFHASSGINGPVSVTGVNFVNGHATLNAFLPSGFNSLNFNVDAPTFHGSQYVTIEPSAHIFTGYMNSPAALIPGACQIFSIVPETPSGDYGWVENVDVSVSAAGGQVYTDSACTTPLIGLVHLSKSVPFKVLFYKNTNPSVSDAIQINPPAPYVTSQIAVTTTAGGTVGAATQFMLLGSTLLTHPSADMMMSCYPYAVAASDAQGMFVDIGTSQSITVNTSNLGGMFMYAYDSWGAYGCNGSNPATLPEPPGYETLFLNNNANGGSAHNNLTITGAGLSAFSTIVGYY